MVEASPSSRDASAKRADDSPLLPGSRTGRGVWDKLALAALVLTVLAATFTYEEDFDAFWHLACGNWMLQHQSVLSFDPFTSEPEEKPFVPWVDVYWLFQLVMASLHSVGGWPILTVCQCLLSGAAFALFALSLRKEVPTAWLVASALVMLPVFASRIRIRPEMFTLPMLMTALVLVDGVRRGGPARRLWWLVPMMLTWVNMHGLYFLGLVVAWGAMLGAVLDKRLGRAALAGNLPTQAALAPILAATVACLVSPWPLEAALHPLRLWSRISGQAFYYTYGVSEFAPTWQNLNSHTEMLVLVGLTALVMALNARRVPLAHGVWMAPFLMLGAMAARNVALLAPVCGLPLAWHGAGVLRRIAARKPGLARIAPAASALGLLALLAATGAYATEYVYRVRNVPTRTGAGLCPDYYPVGLAQYLGQLDAPGDVFCPNFGDASAFIYYSYPKRKVWMDGRLEIKSQKRFEDFWKIQTALHTPAGADRVDLPASARFFPVTNADSEAIVSLSQCSRFRLIRVDEVGACFARVDWSDPRPSGPDAEELPSQPNLGDFDLPAESNALLKGIPPHPPRWYRQNPRSEYLSLASLMYALGETPVGARPGEATALQRRCTLLACRYFAGAAAEGVMAPDLAHAYLAQSLQQWSRQTAEKTGDGVPIDVDLARALYLYSQANLPGLPEDRRWLFGNFLVKALVQGGHRDAAVEAAEGLVKLLSPQQQLFPPPDYVDMRNMLRQKLDEARTGLVDQDLRGLSALQRARARAAPDRGLTLDAIRELRAEANLDPPARLALADFLLRLGRPGEARKEYQAASAGGADGAAVHLRLALCDWVEGDLFAALDNLRATEMRSETGTIKVAPAPLSQYYEGLLLEELGHYAQAKDALRAASAGGPDPELARRIEQARQRLP